MSKEVYARAVEAGSKLRVKSALNPMLWLCAILSAPILGASCFVNVPWHITAIATAPVLATIYSYIYFMHKSPEKLQSEQFQVKMFELEMAHQTGQSSPKPVALQPKSTNPSQLLLDENGPDE